MDIEPKKNSYAYTILGAALLIAAAFAVYYSALGNGFVYDDKLQILRNPWITDLRYLKDIFSTHTLGYTETEHGALSYRPMVFVIYMIEHALFGLEPLGWHAVNILLHAVNGVLVFLLIRTLIEGREPRPGVHAGPVIRYIPPFAGALFFIVHPVNSEVVAWVACIPELFYTLTGLSAFYLYISSGDGSVGRRRCGAYTALSVLLCFVAMLTKETAVLLPGLFFIYYVIKERRGGRVFDLALVKRYAPYAAATVVYLALRAYVLSGEMTPSTNIRPHLNGAQFVLNAFPLFLKDLKMLIIPYPSYPFQLLRPVYSLSEPRAFLSLLLIIVIPVAAFLLRKRLEPLYYLAFSFIVLPLLPTLYVPAISLYPYADRYLYLPSVGLALIAALLINKGIFNGAVRKKMLRISSTAVVFLIVVVLYSGLSYSKGPVWKDDYSLWGRALEGSPDHYGAIYSIGSAYFNEGRNDEAVRMLERAIDVNLKSRRPNPAMILRTRKILAAAYGGKGLVEEAIAEYVQVLRVEPENATANYNLALLYKGKGLYGDAVELFSVALLFAREPWQFKDIYSNLGACYLGMGRRAEALKNYEAALTYAPGDSVIINIIKEVGRAGVAAK